MRHRLVLVTIAAMAPLVLLLLLLHGPVAGEEAPKPIPARAKAIRNPIEASKQSIQRGKLIFSSQCTMCHGIKGDGTGDLVPRLKLSMPDFNDPEQQKQWSDGEMFWVIKNGHGRMPAQGERFEDEVWWNIINYIRTLSAN